MKLLRSLLVPALLLAGGCRRSAESAPAGPATAIPVRVALVTSTLAPQTQAVAGTVRPFARATVAAKVTGTVATTQLVVGQPVTAGDLLVTLQAGELGARVAQARAALAQAEREYEREHTLEAQGATTTDSVRAANDRRQQARAAADEAAAMLTYTQVAAPFSGVLTGEFVKPGDLAQPGTPLFEIEGLDHLRAEVQVPESLAFPAPGTTLQVMLGDTALTGKLAEFSPAADPASRTRLAKLDLPARSPALSGQFVRVLWPAADATTLTVPVSAVSVLGQMERVFVVAAGRAHLRLVKTGARTGARLEVAAGLDAGESVILGPSAALRDGQAVEITP